MKTDEIINTVLTACRQVRNELGPFHQECVYHKGLEVELTKQAIDFDSEVVTPVFYRGHYVGFVRVDVLVAKELIVELKAVQKLKDEHSAQAMKYMRVLNVPKALVVNMAGNGFDIESRILG